ncbi:MAG: cysteine desulfurase family protein [Tissierellia bacterium]|nr:cysteine desulfurase family protein [Tissierellia bacterium]
MEVYLDNSATTKIKPEVLDELIDVYVNDYGNPSSLHRKGLEIEKKINVARKLTAKVINAKPEEIFFTSGGTESNNIALIGHLSSINYEDKKNIVTTKIEHPSVYNVFRHFEGKIDVRYLDTDENGYIDKSQLINQIDDNTLLISIIYVNNEIGTVQDLEDIIKIVKKKNNKTKIHIDAIQAFGKIRIDVNKIDVDTISFSSHKIHGPKGVGGLYIKQGNKINSIIFGGHQEKGLRPGTENTPGIVGFGKASELLYNNFKEENDKLYELKKQYGNRLLEEIDDIKINSDLTNLGAPHILSVSFKNVKGEVLVHYLEQKEIYVSTGAACSSKAKNDNRVLNAINLERDYINGTIRMSFGYFNNFEEIEYVVKNIKECVNEIRDIMK